MDFRERRYGDAARSDSGDFGEDAEMKRLGSILVVGIFFGAGFSSGCAKPANAADECIERAMSDYRAAKGRAARGATPEERMGDVYATRQFSKDFPECLDRHGEPSEQTLDKVRDLILTAES